MKLSIYRYDPDKDEKPYMKDYDVKLEHSDNMLLDALVRVKETDDSFAFRRSCREGVCGSDAMNINGKNGLACLTNMRTLPGVVVLRPLPGLPVIRDLIVDMTQFFKQYHSIKPYLVNDDTPPEKERLQSPVERDELNGLYECILCASCSTSCPSFWWNPDKFVGPAGLLQAYRFIADSRDQDTEARLDNLEDPYRLFRCHTIMNCVDVCPKGLEPHQGDWQDQRIDGAAGHLSPPHRGNKMRVDERSLSKLKWRCRRGLLENDLFIERFFRQHEETITTRQAAGLQALMDLPDNDLLDLLLRRKEPQDELDIAEVREVLVLMRQPIALPS